MSLLDITQATTVAKGVHAHWCRKALMSLAVAPEHRPSLALDLMSLVRDMQHEGMSSQEILDHPAYVVTAAAIADAAGLDMRMPEMAIARCRHAMEKTAAGVSPAPTPA